jgi:hypothetical protein
MLKKCYSKYDRQAKAYSYNGAWYFVYGSYENNKRRHSERWSSSVYSKEEFERFYSLTPLTISVFDFTYNNESKKTNG